jgi:2-methylisocitrate lyase-like PEP mutase family enzyme
MSTTRPFPTPAPRFPVAPPAVVAEHRRAFRELHERGCFVIPNPWDIGSARYLQHLGFAALATTSAGFAFAQGLPDAEDAVPLAQSLAHFTAMAAAVSLPVHADFASAYAVEPADVAVNVGRCIATGVAGLSIEDATGDPAAPLFELPLAVERVRAARCAIDHSGERVLLTARAECYHVGHADPFPETLRRLRAYAEAGADVLFAPGPTTADVIRELVDAVRPKPVNVLVARDIGLRVDDLAGLGVRRVSVGASLALAAWQGFVRAAKSLRESGRFAAAADLVPYAELHGLFARAIGSLRGNTTWSGTP